MSFSPYVNNGGTCLAIAGPDFAVVAADTRMSNGFQIMTRYKSKSVKLTDKCVMASSGMNADAENLHKRLTNRLTWYEHNHKKQMSTTAVAQLLSVTLYYRRFFPFYTFNVVGGVDADGVGAVYSYDAIGSVERTPYSVSGTGSALIQSLLDNQVAKKHQPNASTVPLTLEETVALVKDAFSSAGERDIYTGDTVEISKITKDGVTTELLQLRRD